MTKINDGGPSFPTYSVLSHCDEGGMSLRDYFAAKAMQGFMANKSNPGTFNPIDDARYAYALADAMLRAREVKS